MNDKLKSIAKGICYYIFDAVVESDRWYRYSKSEDVTFQHECVGWEGGVNFWAGGFAEGQITPSGPKVEWIDLDLLEIREVKEGTLTPEEVEELKRFFNPRTTSFDLRDVIPERFQ